MDNVDIKKLELRFNEVDSELRAARQVITVLELENKHLRQVIEMLITSKSPTL